MTSAYDQEEATRRVSAAIPATVPTVTLRRGPRLILLGLAAGVLVLGAVAAGVFGYWLLSQGGPPETLG